MAASMRHEPDYTSGTLECAELGVSVGWVCHGGSFSDCLPIWNETQEVCLVFVGEHFGEESETRSLRESGHDVSGLDASDLVHLYERDGVRFFEKLNGIFCGILIDRRSSEVFLFNDRYGLGRVYYHEDADVLVAASEAKAILKVFPETRRISARGLGEYASCGYVLQNRSLFEGIDLLPPGSLWIKRRHSVVQKGVYFDRSSWEASKSLSENEFCGIALETLRRVLPRYLKGASKVGMSLTGGLDSRIIMALARPSPSLVECYTHRGPFHECADASVGRRVAQVCGLSHRLIHVADEFLNRFEDLARQCVVVTDGAMDVSGAAGLYANRIARHEIAPIRLTGNYGGQILRGLVELKSRKSVWTFLDSSLSSEMRSATETLRGELDAPRASIIAFKQVPWVHFARYAMEQSQVTVRSPYLDNELVPLAYYAPVDIEAGRRVSMRLIADGNPALAAFPTDRGLLQDPGPWDCLRRKILEAGVKAEYAFDYGMPKWLVEVDRICGFLHLERMFLGRHKYYHFRHYYRHALAPVVQSVLLDPTALSRPYLDRNCVERLVHRHVSGRGNHTMEIHMLLTLDFIHRYVLPG